MYIIIEVALKFSSKPSADKPGFLIENLLCRFLFH